MSSNISNFQLNDLRLSFIWTQTNLDLLKGKHAPNAPMAFLGNEFGYQKKFDEIRLNGGVATGLTFPWHRPTDDFFWLYYLEGKQPVDVSAKLAWKQLMPFRQKLPFTINAPWLNARLFLEAFYYPHGFAILLTVESRQSLTLEQARELSYKVRQDEQFEVDDGSGAEFLYLDKLADKAMAFITVATLGPNVIPSALAIKPFSIWTVVQGGGIDPKLPTPNTGDVHKVLEAVTTWNANFATANLPNLSDASLQIRSKHAAGDVFYGNTRGRAVWFPGTFTLKKGKKRSLSCFHRNLCFTSMQTESLARFVSDTANEIPQVGEGSKLPLAQRYCVTRAAGILARMYSGLDPTTYRSGSPKVHLKDNMFLANINKIRDEFVLTGAPPLT